MSRTLLGVATAVLLAFGADQAHAGWGSYGSHGSWGSTGSYGSYGSHGSRGSWGSHGSHGSHGGWFARHHRVRYYSHGSHGSYGSYGSTGSWGSHGSWGSYSSCGSSGGTVIYSSPSQKVYSPSQKGGGGADLDTLEPPAELPNPDAEAETSAEATLTVRVPAEARIFVNGTLTKSTGTDRHFVSRGLTRGYQYTYEVKAEIERDGELVEETKVVHVQAGRTVDLAFQLEAPADLETTLTLEVPEDAKVFLAGAETKGTGAVRVFKTKKLERGSEWADYAIRVAVDRDGQTLTKEQSITLKAGQSQTLTFDFDANQVAAR